jgi:hypothetical protein
MTQQFLIGAIILGIIALILSMRSRTEAFGTSPGTLVQLASSHVPTEEDLYGMREYQKQVRKDLISMTGSD